MKEYLLDLDCKTFWFYIISYITDYYVTYYIERYKLYLTVQIQYYIVNIKDPKILIIACNLKLVKTFSLLELK